MARLNARRGPRVMLELAARLVLSLTLCMAAGLPARADSGWFDSGDLLLRLDLQLLNDAGVIRLPIHQWPLPRASVSHALAVAKPHFAGNTAVANALERVRARVADERRGVRLSARAAAGEAGLLRDFDSFAREDAELGARADYDAGRFSASVSLTGAANPADDRPLRADGSHATVRFGNWLFSAHTLERFWGPSHESSLILSNNARPMPTFMVERATALPFESRWLSWLGPWRFSFGISQMESEREDIDRPLFMAWRVSLMPFDKMELGISRTAQFCGRQLSCTLNTFGNMLAGNDNVGIDATPENEPGNQMAGFDLRWNSPLGDLPYAVYSQAIGEDESSYLPAKYLFEYGVETWHPRASGSLLQMFAEYSSTTCSANTGRGPYYDCAYQQGRFGIEGYRYHGRSVGHTTDSDAETYSIGGTYTTAGGRLWSATFRTANLNRCCNDTTNQVSSGPARYRAVELGWRGAWLGGELSVDLGAESLVPRGDDEDIEPFGFIGWRRSVTNGSR